MYNGCFLCFITRIHPLQSLDVDLSLIEATEVSRTVKTPDEMWNVVKRSSDPEPINVEPTTSRKGWKTIRLFVSSTFRDFHQEREVLVA